MTPATGNNRCETIKGFELNDEGKSFFLSCTEDESTEDSLSVFSEPR